MKLWAVCQRRQFKSRLCCVDNGSSLAYLRGPYHLINALADHGYISRDGRGIRAKELYTALGITSLSSVLRWGFAYGSMVEHSDDPLYWTRVRHKSAAAISVVYLPFHISSPRDYEEIDNMYGIKRRQSFIEHECSLI